MEVISHSSSSTLNPNAPMFVPSAYRAVEDFSDQWWGLVESSPWFRDYWLQECFCDSQNAPPSSEIYDPFLSDIDALLDDPHSTKGIYVNMVIIARKWNQINYYIILLQSVLLRYYFVCTNPLQHKFQLARSRIILCLQYKMKLISFSARISKMCHVSFFRVNSFINSPFLSFFLI